MLSATTADKRDSIAPNAAITRAGVHNVTILDNVISGKRNAGSELGIPPNAVPIVSTFPGKIEIETIVGIRSATSRTGTRGAIFGKIKMTASPVIAIKILYKFTV